MINSSSHPEKRPAEEELESQRQKRLRVIYDMKDSLMRSEGGFDPASLISVTGACLRFEGLDKPEIRLRLIADIDDFLLRSQALDLAIDTEDCNQLLCKMKETVDTFVQDAAQVAFGGDITQIIPPPESAGTLLGEEPAKPISSKEIMIEEEEEEEEDEEELYIWRCSPPKTQFPPTQFPPKYCRFCKEVTEHFPVYCPVYEKSCLPPPLPTPQQLAEGRDYFCPLCKDYTAHGRYRCPIENNVYQPLPGGGFQQTKCEVCRKPLHPGSRCVLVKPNGSYLS